MLLPSFRAGPSHTIAQMIASINIAFDFYRLNII